MDEDQIEVTRMNVNLNIHSSLSSSELQSHNNNECWFDRDTSNTSRHFELNNTRDSSSSTSSTRRQEITLVNTVDSILDLDSQCDDGDDDDDDDDDTSFCNEDEDMLLGIIDNIPSSDAFSSNGNSNKSISSISMDKGLKSRPVTPSQSPSASADCKNYYKQRNNKSNSNMSTNTISNNNNNTTQKTKRTNYYIKQEDFEDQKYQKNAGIMDTLTFYSVTDSLVDTICTSTACTASNNNEPSSITTKNNNNNKSPMATMDDKIKKFQKSCHSAFSKGCDGSDKSFVSNDNEIVSMDIWQLLGCASPPGESELADIWSIRTKTTPEMLRNGQLSQNDGETKQAVRASIKKRLRRIHRLRMDHRRISGASRHGVTITKHCIEQHPSSLDHNHNSNLNNIRKDIHMNKINTNDSNTTIIQDKNHIGNGDNHHQSRKQPQPLMPSSYHAIGKSYSMLDDSLLADFIGQGMVEPIPVEAEEDGYDSDPEINYSSPSSSMIISDSQTLSQADQMEVSPPPSSPSSISLPSLSSSNYYPQHHTNTNTHTHTLSNDHRDVLRVDPIPTDQTEMRESVQQTLNSTWTLTWHPNPENRKEYNISCSKPICINMWIERGTVITSSGVVIEPSFMWRDAYQPLLLSQHKLNDSTQNPWSMRLLNACRITPTSKHGNIDRSKYPLARQNSSFLLKSCGGEEFLLEAGTPEAAIAITERWKLVVARFACLAVTEDVGGIAKEFFHPTCSDSKMLTFSDLTQEDTDVPVDNGRLR